MNKPRCIIVDLLDQRMSNPIPLELPRKVLRALFVYEQQRLWPYPASYRVQDSSFGHEKVGDSKGQEVIGEMIELLDHNNDILAEYWIPPTGKTKFVNKKGSKRWFDQPKSRTRGSSAQSL